MSTPQMTFGAKALQVLRTVAPTIAMAVGGPFGPLAATVIHAALGTDPGDPKAAEAALLNATPEQLLALKKADQDFIIRLKELGIEEQQLAYADTASARQMQVAVRDPTVDRLAWLIIGGFLVISLAQLIGLIGFATEVNKIPAQGWLLIGNLSGYLANEAKQAAAFYFGSTASGQNKDATIASIAKEP